MNEILWIGGPAAAGKTTVSRLLARRHGLVWYSVDAHAFDHEHRAAVAGLHVLGAGPGDFDRKPMILEDIDALPVRTPVVVEGAFVTPGMAGAQALWLMPSQAEQRTRLQQRNPDLDHEGFTWGWNLVNSQLDGTGATTIHVDGQTPEQTLNAVERYFTAVLPPSRPSADPALIRLGNHQLADRPTPQPFACECPRPDCTAVINLGLTESAPLLSQPPPSITAPTH